MKFNKEQEMMVYQFTKEYLENEEYKEDIQNRYMKEPHTLSILRIYGYEEILREGDKGIYRNFLSMKGNMTVSDAVEQVDQFSNLLKTNESFKQYKLSQLEENPETLSQLEKYVLSLLDIHTEKQEGKAYEQAIYYDAFNPIKYGDDSEIKMTLMNLLIGEFIHELLKRPGMEEIRNRQLKEGLISNIDKPFIIEYVYKAFQRAGTKIGDIINNQYMVVKFNVLLGKEKEAFDEYLKYNTNVSAFEVYNLSLEKEKEKTK